MCVPSKTLRPAGQIDRIANIIWAIYLFALFRGSELIGMEEWDNGGNKVESTNWQEEKQRTVSCDDRLGSPSTIEVLSRSNSHVEMDELGAVSVGLDLFFNSQRN